MTTDRDDIARGPDFAFPMEDAPKDGSILRLLVKFDRKSAAGAFEDTTEPSWTIGTNNKANTGEDQWDIVGWSWEQDVFCHAYGAKAIGWLPFHTESNEPTALPSPAPAESGAVAWQGVAPDSRVEITRVMATAHEWIASDWFVRPLYANPPAPSASMGRVTVDDLAQIIRRVDGKHSLGAGELAERILAALDSPPDHGGGEGRVFTVYDWAWTDETGQEHYARTPERAKRLTEQGHKLTAVYTLDSASLPNQESEDGR